eukprot:4134818-Amphidinium_carterae.2
MGLFCKHCFHKAHLCNEVKSITKAQQTTTTRYGAHGFRSWDSGARVAADVTQWFELSLESLSTNTTCIGV